MELGGFPDFQNREGLATSVLPCSIAQSAQRVLGGPLLWVLPYSLSTWLWNAHFHMPWALEFPAAFTTGFYQQLLKLNGAAVHRMSLGSALPRKRQVKELQNTDLPLPSTLSLTFPGRCLGKSCFHRRRKKRGRKRKRKTRTQSDGIGTIVGSHSKCKPKSLNFFSVTHIWPSNHILDFPLWPISLGNRKE